MPSRWIVLTLLGVGVICAWVALRPKESVRPVPTVATESTDAGYRTSPSARSSTARQMLETQRERSERVAKMREHQIKRAGAVVAAGKRNLQSAFDAERPNPGWARAKEAELEGYVINPQMEALDAVPTAFNVECRSATCRIEADFTTATALEDWTTLFLTNNAGALPRSSITRNVQPDGTVRLVLLGSTR